MNDIPDDAPPDWAGLYTCDEEGNPVPCYDTLAWGRWIETANRRVCVDYDEGDPQKQIRVSTVFLGIDHSFGHRGPPILWETMVFVVTESDPRGTLDDLSRRYSSLADAIEGHQQVCRLVMNTIKASGAKTPHG